MWALRVAACMLLALTVPASAQFSSTAKHRYDTDCSDLKLQSAGGVPHESKHKYSLAGTCRYIHHKTVNGDAKAPKEEGRAFMTLGAVWNAKDNTFKEQGKLEGGVTGKFSTVLKCSSDPYLSNVSCTLIAHTNSTPWQPLSNRPLKGRPIGQGYVKAAEAAQLSKKSAAAPPPPPPPPAPKKKPPVLKSPAGAAGKAPVLKSPLASGKAPVVRATPRAGARGLLNGGMQDGVDLFGGDYKGFPLARPNPELCRQACSRENRCRSWTYVKPGIKGPQAACFLKNVVPQPRRDACCVSGVK